VEWYLSRKNQILHNKICPNATLYTIWPTLTALGLKWGCCGKKPAYNSMSYGMAYSFVWKVNIHTVGQEIYHLYVMWCKKMYYTYLQLWTKSNFKLGFILDGRYIRQKRNTVIIFNIYCFVPDHNYIMCCHLQYLRFVVYDVIIQCHSVYIIMSHSYAVISFYHLVIFVMHN
jgi:hypothetical protein